MRRHAPAVAAAVVAAAALVVVGRSEGARHADRENRGIARVLAAIGPLGQSSLDAYRVSLVEFDCLLYERGGNPYALEVCVDEQGRVLEAIDRRSGSPRIWSIREDPGAATVRVDHAEVERLLRRLGVPAHVDAGPRGQ